MSDAPLGRLQRAARGALLGVSIAGLGVFPAAWWVARTAAGRQALLGAEPVAKSAPELGSGTAASESQRLIGARRPREALARLEPALKLEPGNAKLWCNACVAHGLLGNRRQAVEACSRAVALQPFTPLFVNNLAWVRSLPPQPESTAL